MWYIYSLFMLLVTAAAATPSSAWTSQIIDVTNATQRCVTRHCTCSVRPGPRPTNPTQLVQMERRFEIHFSENSYELSSSSSSGLQHFLQQFQDQGRLEISLIGYTDGCGTSQHNRVLSADRARSVQGVVSQVFPTARISRVAAGEKTSAHYPEARRVDVVVHSSRRIATLIEKVPADVYLIDASGSMWNDWTRWTDVINASYRTGGRVYVSMTSGCYNGKRLNNVQPQGATEIWYSYWWVLSNAVRQGETLAIISDFKSEVALTTSERRIIESIVAEKQVRIIAITP